MLNLPAPDFELPATGGATVRLSAQRGNYVVLYFYPKDNTPGCTTESADFRNQHEGFAAHDCMVYGISRDSLKSHANFQTKLELPFELLSDAEETACQLYSVIKQKKMYGKEVRGIERSTFLIDRQGIVQGEWRGVKVPGHALAVLDKLKSIYD